MEEGEIMKKKFLAVVLSLCMPFSMTVSAQTAKNAADETAREVVIYHTNDTHGYLSGDGESIVGIDMAAGLKESTPNSILVDSRGRHPGTSPCFPDQGSRHHPADGIWPATI